MQVQIDHSWQGILQDEFLKPYFQSLVDFVKSEYVKHTIYPPGKKIFAAFEHCKFDQVKIVILGQDPYHGKGQANGLCFSVNDGIQLPPSLENIFKEIHNDLNIAIPKSGNLERWAKQGVLLLNVTLTVRAKSPGSHQHKGWEIFTDEVIKNISAVKEGIVFMLWGAYAQKKSDYIDHTKHYILKSPHPSPFSAHRGFFGNKHFSKANAYLYARKIPEINW